MAAITLEIAQEHLDMWLEAERAIATSQGYKIGTRSLTRADLNAVRKQILFWTNISLQLSRKGRNRVYRVVPRDL